VACGAQIIKPGEVANMTEGQRESKKKEAPKKDKFQEEFREMPLEEKIKVLLRMEAVTLQETFSYGLHESMKAADRLGEVLADFAKKVEAEFKKATHHDRNASARSKSGSAKKPPPKTESAV